MATELLTAEIRARDRASRQINKVEGRLKRLSKTAGALGRRFGGAAAVGGAAFLAFSAKAVQLASKQATVNKRLRLAIDRVGGSYDDASRDIKAFQNEMQATTKFGDDEMAVVLTTLTSLTGSFGKETFDAARTVADFAEGAMVPMASAGRLVSQAIAGNIAALTRYIPSLKGTDSATFALKDITERTAVVVDALASAFGGSAKAISASEQGLANLKNTSGDVLEAFGKMVIELGNIAGKTDTVIAGLQAMERHFNVTERGVSRFADSGDAALKAFGTRLNRGVVDTGEFNDTLARLESAGINVSNVFATKLTVFLDAYNKAANKATEATKAFKDEQAGFARAAQIASGALTAVDFSEGTEITGGKKKKRRDKDPGSFAREAASIQLVLANSQELQSQQRQRFKMLQEFEADQVAMAAEDLAAVFEKNEALRETVRQEQEIAKALGEASMAQQAFFDSFKAAALTSVINQMSAAFVNLGATGEFAGQQMLSGMLKAMGQIAVQMGTMLILAGTGFSAIPPFTGGAAIGAGIGLIALGAALGAAGGAVAPSKSGGTKKAARSTPSDFAAAGEGASASRVGPNQTTLVLTFGGVPLHTKEEIGREVDGVLAARDRMAGVRSRNASAFRR